MKNDIMERKKKNFSVLGVYTNKVMIFLPSII